jgi:hypothetical protein
MFAGIVRPLLVGVGLLAIGSSALAQEIAMPCAPEPTDMPIAYGTLLSGENCTLSPSSDIDIFRFPGQAGERALIRLTNLTGGRTICGEVLRGVTVVASKKCSNGVDPFDVDIVDSGTYTLVVSETQNRDLAYALVLERNKPTSPTIVAVRNQQIVEAGIDTMGDIDFFVFKGTSGDVVQLDVTNLSGGVTVCAQLLGPGFDPTPNGGQKCNNSLVEFDESLPSDGIYTIQIAETLGRPMNYSAAITCLFGTCQTVIHEKACRADVNGDNVVNVVDLGILKSEFFKFCVDEKPTP